MKTNLSPVTAPHLSPAEQEILQQAYIFAIQAHSGQVRKSGEEFVSHPIAVAQILSDWRMDLNTLVAGLLHDTVEDTEVTLPQIQEKFGEKVAELVDGVTKLSGIDPVPSDSVRHEVSTENIRKLLLAMTKDIRVIIIKLADRLHNLTTLKYLTPDKQKQIAEESLEVYAPLADRLGMGEVKTRIEDLSFKYYLPAQYKEVSALVSGQVLKTERYITRLKRQIDEELRGSGIEAISIEGRRKHMYSIYKKLQKVEGDIDKIYDLVALRIIVRETEECYKTLGILHQKYKPLIYRIKDYIAVPKPNGYRSLHTTVFALEGKITEIQIRTERMHEEAERGLAAHFFYDSQKGTKDYKIGRVQSLPEKLNWVTQLADLTKTTVSGQELVESLRLDLFRDRIFIFSPDGDLYDLPEGSTPVDFAFAVHSSLGLHLQGAKVNGKLVPIDTKLENRDVVEIIRRKTPSPNRDWMNFVVTPQARSRIRAWFRAVGKEQNIASGREMLEKELRTYGYKSVDDIEQEKIDAACTGLNVDSKEALLAQLGEGAISLAQAVRRLFPEKFIRPSNIVVKNSTKSSGIVIVKGAEQAPHSLAPCCNPTGANAIIGYVTRGRGITIHTRTCPNIPKEPDRLVPAYWEGRETYDQAFSYDLVVMAVNRVGLLRDLTEVISALFIDINRISSTNMAGGQTSKIVINVRVQSLPILSQVIKNIERLPSILSVDRANQTPE